jgi:glycosyltransferase involved in cell wall biosynthesis
LMTQKTPVRPVRAAVHPTPDRQTLRVAFVLWDGGIGGAERSTNAIAVALRAAGVDARVVFVGDPFPACRELEAKGVPFVSFEAVRGRQIMRTPRAFAETVTAAGADVAVLQTARFLPAVIRLGGYRGKLVSVEHGELPRKRSKLVHFLDERSGIWALDAQIAVSDYMRADLLQRSHARRVEVLYGGIDLERFTPGALAADGQGITFGFAGRLVRGKGVEHLLHALDAMSDTSARLSIAGEGPERDAFERLTDDLALRNRVKFVGLLDDMPAFWQSCDVAVVPSVEPEGAGMVALEAAACGKPVIATAAGGLTELVMNGTSGTVVAPGDMEAMARALDVYAADGDLRAGHGLAGRKRCEDEFALERCARNYLALFSSLVGVRS